jgi:hypothetical protein
LRKLDRAQQDVESVQDSQGSEKFLEAVLSSSAALVVGLAALLGLSKHVKSGRKRVKGSKRQATTAER